MSTKLKIMAVESSDDNEPVGRISSRMADAGGQSESSEDEGHRRKAQNRLSFRDALELLINTKLNEKLKESGATTSAKVEEIEDGDEQVEEDKDQGRKYSLTLHCCTIAQLLHHSH